MLGKYFQLDKNIFIPALLFAILSIAVIPYKIYAFAFIIFAILTVKYGEKFLLAFVIFTYITIPGDVSGTLRMLLNIFNFLILGYLFIKKYGVDVKKYPRVPGLLLGVIIFTVAVMIVSALLSYSLNTGLIEIGRTLIFLVILYWLYAYLDNDSAVFEFINAMILSAVVISASLFIEFFNTDKFLFMLGSMGYVTLGGYFTNSTAVGGYLAVSSTLTFIYLFFTEFRKYRNLIIVAFIFQILALLLTNARAAIAASFVAITVFMFFTNRKIFKRLVLSAILIGVLLFILPYISSVMDNYFRVNRILENTRYYLWDMAFGMIKDHPLFGVGPGMFNHYMYAYLPVRMGSWTEREMYVLQQIAASPEHNFFLMRAAEEGIMGLLSAIGIFYIFFSYGFRSIKKNMTGNRRYYLISAGITSIGAGLFVRSFFEATGIFTDGWITRDLPFWLLFSILVYLILKIPDKLVASGYKKTD